MRVIAVMDLIAGQVVRGIAGRRVEYRPIESKLTSESTPVAVATALREQLDLRAVYVADLDALTGGQPSWDIYTAIAGVGMELMIDAGLSELVRTRKLVRLIEGMPKGGSVIAALESIPSPDLLADILEVAGPEKTIFSLDLKRGVPITSSVAWPAGNPQAILQQALKLGIRRFILLDLARIGLGEGPGTHALCRYLRELAPDVEIIAGGGMKSIPDLLELEAAGCNGALVASALHDGLLGRADLAKWR